MAFVVDVVQSEVDSHWSFMARESSGEKTKRRCQISLRYCSQLKSCGGLSGTNLKKNRCTFDVLRSRHIDKLEEGCSTMK